MSIICPTVTSEDLATFKAQLQLVASFADRIHIDIMDGEFAPTLSPSLEGLALPGNKVVDIHVMHKMPDTVLPLLVSLNPSMIIIHAEAEADFPLIASKLRHSNINTGLAILPETSVDSIMLRIPHAQHVLIFGGHLGYHGGVADLSQLEKVAQVRKIQPSIEIGWDGGANDTNIPTISRAGVNVINVGSCIHGSQSPSLKYAQLAELIK